MAPLIAARAAGGVRWTAVADIVKTRATDLTLRQSLGDALTAITTHYAAAADELIALLKTNPFENVRRATVHANVVGAPKAYVIWQLEQYTGADANVYFLAHVNAWHEYLAATGPGLVTAMRVRADKQKFIAGSTTDVMHVFTVTFTAAGAGGPVSAELHNHVDLPKRRQTSLHYKNHAQKGCELKRGDNNLSRACKDAVMATPNVCAIDDVNQFPTGYTL